VSDRTTITSLDTTRLVQLVEQLRTHNAQLEQALASRVVIEQAKGILAERYALDMAAAFELLRRAARTNRVRIHELASSVVTSPRTPAVLELEVVRGRSAKGPFPAPSADVVH
jgi:AmiR/NasT family two-component response regulator